LRERLGLDDIISELQQNRLRWYGHVFQKQDNDWVKKCMEYEVESLQTRGLNREDAMDRSRRMKQIRDDG